MPGDWGDAGRGAATGASIGSFIPGVGTVIGAGAGGLLGWLFGHKDDKKEEDKNKHPEDPYTAALKSSSDESRGQGRELTAAGMDTLRGPMDYLRSILSSNPGAVMDATRMERGRVLDQYDSAMKAVANFGPRGGGSTSAGAQAQFDQAETLAAIPGQAKQAAVSGASALGTSLVGTGLQANAQANDNLNQIINSILAREGLNVQARGQNMAMWGDFAQAAGEIVGNILFKGD